MSPPLYPLARRVLFRLDPERAHHAALALARGLEVLLARLPPPPNRGRLARPVLGREFPNPIGLAAGFDKNGVAPHLWGRLGFAERLARRLVRRPAIPIGLNVGASRAVVGDPEAEREDYRISVRLLAPLADYLVVNVSSPNTPGLRDLQSPERLAALVAGVRDVLAGLPGPASGCPLLVKLALDLSDSELEPICQAALRAGANGFVATNTTLARPAGCERLATTAGGLSGAPLRRRSTEVLRRIRAAVGTRVPIVGVGGVMRVDDVLEKLAAGADLVALYSGLVFEGPLLARRLGRELDAAARAAGGNLDALLAQLSPEAPRASRS